MLRIVLWNRPSNSLKFKATFLIQILRLDGTICKKKSVNNPIFIRNSYFNLVYLELLIVREHKKTIFELVRRISVVFFFFYIQFHIIQYLRLILPFSDSLKFVQKPDYLFVTNTYLVNNENNQFISSKYHRLDEQFTFAIPCVYGCNRYHFFSRLIKLKKN